MRQTGGGGADAGHTRHKQECLVIAAQGLRVVGLLEGVVSKLLFRGGCVDLFLHGLCIIDDHV